MKMSTIIPWSLSYVLYIKQLSIGIKFINFLNLMELDNNKIDVKPK